MSNIFGGGGVTAANPASANIVQTLVQTVKQDMEQMERGHQWPYSCYSPAKDCISVPGIDDISPEELRYEAYQAIANGTVAAYQQKCQDTKNSYAAKRQMLYNPSNEMREIFRRIYNKESLAGISSPLTAGSSGGGLFSSTQTSVFGGGASTGPMGTNTSGSLFGATNTSSNLFGARPNAAPTSGSSSIFGGGTGAGTSLFGAGTTPTSSQSSIFGGGGSSIFGSAPTTNQSSVFGSPAQQPTSVFGSQQQPQTGGSVFGGQASIGTAGGGIFGQKRTATTFAGQLGTQGGTSLFGQPAASSIFGGGQQQTPAAPSLFGQPQQTQSSIFGGQTTISAVPTQQPTSLFGQQPAAPSAFGGQPQFQSQSIFGTTSATQQQKPSSGIFGGQQQQSTSIFGQPSAPAPSPFSAPGFGQQQQQQQQQQTPSPFGMISDPQNAMSKPTDNIFGNRTGESEMGGSATTPFGSRPVGVGGGGLFGEVIEPQKDSSAYTPLDRLSKEIYEIFQSGKFELGKIPEVPPPGELCV